MKITAILFQTSNIVKVVKESRTQTWRDEGEGLSFHAVLIVWFIWSATGNMSLRLMYANPSHVSSSWFLHTSYSAHHGNLTQAW